jgi:FKBP-type peptidyl-prolyl cis-trans isomerase 2
MQVVRKTFGAGVRVFKVLDVGSAQQAVSPAATVTLAATTQAPRTLAAFTVTNAATINSGGVLTVAVQWAVAASEPDGGQVLVRYAPGTVPTGAVLLPPVVPGSHVWVRVRTEQAGRRSSAWSEWEDVTLGTFDPPENVSADEVTAESAVITWDVANDEDLVDVYVAPGSSAPGDGSAAAWAPYRFRTFPAGSTRAVVRGLEPGSTDYIVGVAHRDAATGEISAVDTDTLTTDANPETAPTPLGLMVVDLEEDAAYETGIAMGLWAADETFPIEIQRADDDGGLPGEFETIATVNGATEIYLDPLPSDGLVRWYRIRHVLPGYAPSPWTGTQSATPGALPDNIARPSLRPILNVFDEPGDPDWTIHWSGQGTIEVNIDGGGYGTPSASPITVPVTSVAQVYVFRATLNGLETTATVVIPGDPGLIPAVSNAVLTETVSPACGVNWELEVAFDCDPENDAEYRVRLMNDITEAEIADGISTVNNPGENIVTAVVGDTAFSDFNHQLRVRVEVVRISDDMVMNSVVSNLEQVDTGPAC